MPEFTTFSGGGGGSTVFSHNFFTDLSSRATNFGKYLEA